jgi:hypothetical protein
MMHHYKYLAARATRDDPINFLEKVQVKSQRPHNQLKKRVCSIGAWLWRSYCDYARSTIYYDEYGVAHSTMWWF